MIVKVLTNILFSTGIKTQNRSDNPEKFDPNGAFPDLLFAPLYLFLTFKHKYCIA